MQSRTAKAEFKIPYSEKEVKYTVLIMVYGKDTSDFVRVNESFKANNPKTLWKWISNGK